MLQRIPGRSKDEKESKNKSRKVTHAPVLICGYPDFASVVVLGVEKITELRQQFWPGLQLSFRGNGCDQDA